MKTLLNSLCSVTYSTVCGGVIYIWNKSKYLKTEVRYARAVKTNLCNFKLLLKTLWFSIKPYFSFHIPFNMFLNEMKWNEMKWNEMKWNEMRWNEMKWNMDFYSGTTLFIPVISNKLWPIDSDVAASNVLQDNFWGVIWIHLEFSKATNFALKLLYELKQRLIKPSQRLTVSKPSKPNNTVQDKVKEYM